MIRVSVFIFFLFVITCTSCRDSRMFDQPELARHFEAQGIKKACFILRDNNHESVHYYNKEECLQRKMPASTFKIFNSLVGLETAIAPDDNYLIRWDSVQRWNPDWNKDMTMREAFKVSNVGYYQELARKIGPEFMQHYLDTVKYGNMRIGTKVDEFWLNDTLQISADEQVGFLKDLYFNELPFAERSQRIVKSMMLQEETPHYKLYYKTGWGKQKDKQVLWIVGFAERIEHMKEHEKSMNKGNDRVYPYFFAMNFEVGPNDETKQWAKVRIDILYDILKELQIITPAT